MYYHTTYLFGMQEATFVALFSFNAFTLPTSLLFKGTDLIIFYCL